MPDHTVILTASTLDDYTYRHSLYAATNYEEITVEIAACQLPDLPIFFILETRKMQQILASLRLTIQKNVKILILICEKTLEMFSQYSWLVRVKNNKIIPVRVPFYGELHVFTTCLECLIQTVNRIRNENMSARTVIISENFLKELGIYGFVF